MISPGAFFHSSKFWFSRLLGGRGVGGEGGGGVKSAKNGQKWQKFLSVALLISVNIHHMIVIYGTDA